MHTLEDIASMIVGLLWGICASISVIHQHSFINEGLAMLIWLAVGAIIYGVFWLIDKIITYFQKKDSKKA